MSFSLIPGLAPLYIDPGTGALVWQFLAGAALGALFFLRRAKNWLLERLHVRRRGAEEPSDTMEPR